VNNELPTRKHPRLKEYDYNSAGGYFLTICVEDMRKLLGEVVGRYDSGAPYVQLSKYGLVAQKYLEQIELSYQNVFVDKYVVMPNHIHILIRISQDIITPINGGAPRSSRPTSMISRILTAFKKLTNKEFRFNMWQDSFHDHIIRNEEDYLKYLQYIENNPAKWTEDKYYKKEG